jgi:hypothetical protein
MGFLFARPLLGSQWVLQLRWASHNKKKINVNTACSLQDLLLAWILEILLTIPKLEMMIMYHPIMMQLRKPA